MKTLECRGSSDDTFGVYFRGNDGRSRGEDHDDCANFTVRSFTVDAGADGRVIVIGVYGKCPDGTWAIGLSPVEEGDPWPSWAQPKWSVDGYTPVMTMEVPDHTTVRLAAVDGEPVGKLR